MPGTLLYLTDRWPHQPGESFVSNEIRDLAPHFDRLLVLPLAEDVDESLPLRDVPDGVEVLENVRSAAWLRWKRSGLLRRFGMGVARPGVVLSNISKAPVRDMLGEVAQVRLLASSVEAALDPSSVDAVAAFWLNRGASVAAELKRRHPHLVAFARGHGGDIYSKRRGMAHLPLQRETLRLLDGILPDSQAGVDHLCGKYPENKTRIHVGRLGVDDQQQNAEHSTDGILRLLSVSGLVPVKRVHLIPEALEHTTRDIIWTHIGDGECKVGVEAAAASVGDNVDVRLVGQKPHAEVLQHYCDEPVDLLINVSSSEGLPVSIMEAFSFGVPAMVTAVGGSPEIVTESCGHLLPPDFEPTQLTHLLEKHDLEDQVLRAGALEMQHTQYSSKRNQAAFAAEIHAAMQRKQD